MKGKLILPPEYPDIMGPLVFLAGPILGAEDWQSKAIKILKAIRPDLRIASPRKKYVHTEFDHKRQVDWETHHLWRASINGAIMFWLAKEFEHNCQRAYAQTSRFELGEWKAEHKRCGVLLAVGIEEGFPGGRYIRHRLSQDCPNVPICSSLEITCKALVNLF